MEGNREKQGKKRENEINKERDIVALWLLYWGHNRADWVSILKE